MSRYVGLLQSDVFTSAMNEMRLAMFAYTAAQGAAADAGAVHAAITGSATVTVTTTADITNPPGPRNLVVTPGGTTTDVKAGDVTVYGTNLNDEPISEEFTFFGRRNRSCYWRESV